MTHYVGSGPYCYANTLSTVLGPSWSPSLIETLTGSPFGYQMTGPLPLFDPHGWNPDTGLNQALTLLGWTSRRETFTDPEHAYRRLTDLSSEGPVFVGPLEMGLLGHQPGPDRPLGADHFVAVLDADDDGVTMHDPQGHPYAWLPPTDFLTAWGSDTLGYGDGRFPLRSSFQRDSERSPQEALSDLLPLAVGWAEQDADHLGNAEGLRSLARAAIDGLSDPALPVLVGFALRLGARRRVDAASWLRPWPKVAEAVDRQARVLGRAQLAAVRADGLELARTFAAVADLHDEMLEALRAATP